MTELSTIKLRIRALTRKTVGNGCTEAEALAAADMVNRLLERYALSMSDIELQQSACIAREIPFRARPSQPMDRCLAAIAQFCDCKAWITHKGRDGFYVFFGMESDADLAGYLHRIIETAIRTEAVIFFRQHRTAANRVPPIALRSFQHGMANRIAERLSRMHAEREASVAGQQDRGMALVTAKHNAVEDAFGDTNIQLTPVPQEPMELAEEPFRLGEIAGEGVKLT